MVTPSRQQFDPIIEKLNADRQMLLREVRDELERSGDQNRIDLLNREPGDSGDESLANALADFNVAMLDRQIHGLRDIESAFQRIKNDEYGVCVDCGQEIAFTRLHVYPTAKRCVHCQERREKLYSHEGQPKM